MCEQTKALDTLTTKMKFSCFGDLSIRQSARKCGVWQGPSSLQVTSSGCIIVMVEGQKVPSGLFIRRQSLQDPLPYHESGS